MKVQIIDFMYFFFSINHSFSVINFSLIKSCFLYPISSDKLHIQFHLAQVIFNFSSVFFFDPCYLEVCCLISYLLEIFQPLCYWFQVSFHGSLRTFLISIPLELLGHVLWPRMLAIFATKSCKLEKVYIRCGWMECSLNTNQCSELLYCSGQLYSYWFFSPFDWPVTQKRVCDGNTGLVYFPLWFYQIMPHSLLFQVHTHLDWQFSFLWRLLGLHLLHWLWLYLRTPARVPCVWFSSFLCNLCCDAGALVWE